MSGYSPAVEDYLEAVHVIGMKHKVVRVKDVAQHLGVTMPSVVSAVKNLTEKGLAVQERYGHIELTPRGLAVAREVFARHKLLLVFFHEILGLDVKVAEQDACRVEHHLSSAAQERLLKLIEYVRACPRGTAEFLRRFILYAETGKYEPCGACVRQELPEGERQKT